MGGKREKTLLEFIDSIPDIRLEGFPGSEKTVFRDDNFRMDMQCVSTMTTPLARSESFQFAWANTFLPHRSPATMSGIYKSRFNYETPIPTLKPLAPKTVSGPALVPRTAPLTPDEIRDIFRNTINFEDNGRKKSKKKKRSQ